MSTTHIYRRRSLSASCTRLASSSHFDPSLKTRSTLCSNSDILLLNAYWPTRSHNLLSQSKVLKSFTFYTHTHHWSSSKSWKPISKRFSLCSFCIILCGWWTPLLLLDKVKDLPGPSNPSMDLIANLMLSLFTNVLYNNYSYSISSNISSRLDYNSPFHLLL